MNMKLHRARMFVRSVYSDWQRAMMDPWIDHDVPLVDWIKFLQGEVDFDRNHQICHTDGKHKSAVWSSYSNVVNDMRTQHWCNIIWAVDLMDVPVQKTNMQFTHHCLLNRAEDISPTMLMDENDILIMLDDAFQYSPNPDCKIWYHVLQNGLIRPYLMFPVNPPPYWIRNQLIETQAERIETCLDSITSVGPRRSLGDNGVHYPEEKLDTDSDDA